MLMVIKLIVRCPFNIANQLPLVTLSCVGDIVASNYSSFISINRGTIIDGETKRSSLV